MIAAAFLLLQAVPTPPPVPPRDAVPLDWSVLPPLPYAAAPRMIPAYSAYVAGEITAGRCGLTRPVDGHWNLRLEIAVLVDAGGVARRLVPRAIGCPTVEQYAAGLVQAFARGNLARSLPTEGSRWYRTAITFEWTQ